MADVASTESVALRNWHRACTTRATCTTRCTGLTCWAPVVNIARGARWDRVLRRGPAVYTALAAPFVRALQGAHPHYLKVVAILTIAASVHTGAAFASSHCTAAPLCARGGNQVCPSCSSPMHASPTQGPHPLKVAAGVKHFTVYDGPEEGRFSLDTAPPLRDLEATWLVPWRRLLRHTGTHPLSGVMASYSAVEGVPICANRRRDLPLPACLLPACLIRLTRLPP